VEKKMDVYFSLFVEKTQPIGDIIIQWAKPSSFPVESPTSAWYLTDFSTALAIAIVYLSFVFVGRIVMSKCPAVPGLYPIKFAYNMAQVMLCSYMSIEAGMKAYEANYTILPCNKFNHTSHPIAFILYIFYLSKILDFLDTVFIILEKKWDQLSFLHVYHHTTIFLFYWLNIKVGYDGDVYLTIVLNGMIHTMMYTYYFVSMHTKTIWWKPALTAGQLAQFVLMVAQATYLISSGCKEYPVNIIFAYGVYICSLFVLFLNFFIVKYLSGEKN